MVLGDWTKHSKTCSSMLVLSFMHEEISSRNERSREPICIIYAPDKYDPSEGGKIIIEVDATVACFFELTPASKTSLDEVVCEEIFGAYRYSGISVNHTESVDVVRDVLFSSLFKQRFLMTIESRALGSINMQRYSPQ